MEQDPPLVKRIPKFTLLPTADNARCQFADVEQLQALREAATRHSLWMRCFVELASTVGWRRSELLNLRVSQFDRLNGTLTLPAAMSKSKARLAVVPPLAKQLLLQLVTKKKGDSRVFTRSDGTPVLNINRAWQDLCIAAGLSVLRCRACGSIVVRVSPRVMRCPTCDQKVKRSRVRYASPNPTEKIGFLIHSLRRTVARDMISGGANEDVTMRTCGWATRSMLTRYNIIETDSLAAAQRQLAQKRAADLERLAAEKAASITSCTSRADCPDLGASQAQAATLEN